MELRIIVPIQWDSSLRVDLFNALKAKGYTWSRGESLDSNQPNCVNAKYIAISTTRSCVTYSSHMEIVEKVNSQCGYNYMLKNPTVEKAIQMVDLIKKYWLAQLSEDQIVSLLLEHNNLVKRIL